MAKTTKGKPLKTTGYKKIDSYNEKITGALAQKYKVILPKSYSPNTYL
jgi:hypothetical protein